MNIFTQIDQFATRQIELANKMMADLPPIECNGDIEDSLLEIYCKARDEAYAWRREVGDNAPDHIKEWTEPDSSTFPPIGIRTSPPRGSLLVELSFTIEACEYNLRALLEHTKSRGVVPYRPLRLAPAIRAKPSPYSQILNMQQDYDYDFRPAYYDQDGEFPESAKDKKRVNKSLLL